MKQTIFRYKILIEEEKDAKTKKSVYVSYVPKLGISDFGETIEQTIIHTKEAIECYLEALDLQNEEIPKSQEATVVSEIPVTVSFLH